MQSISTIGLDIAKSVFQVHGVDAAGQVVVRRQLKRRQRWRTSTNRRLRQPYQRGHKLEKRRGLMKDLARSLWSLSYRNRSRPQHHQQNTEAKSTFWPLLKQWVRFWQGRKCFIFQRGVD
jgi:hypothetical protein